ncbi:DUF5629 family protein [Pseudomonas sp. CrR25]|nr:DUF5629 family protein [Pseudomonas sp. CrR25]
MSTPHSSLVEALENADMLEIDGLYAWQFSLDSELLAQVSAGSADAGSQERPLLRIDCIDGRERRHWQFSLAAVTAASFDAPNDSWNLSDGETLHRLKCFTAINGDNAAAEADDDGNAD